MQFRYDINGLRAFAVIAVLLFHFNPSILPSGFAGVDVFCREGHQRDFEQNVAITNHLHACSLYK